MWAHGDFHTKATKKEELAELLLHITEVRNAISMPQSSGVDGNSWSRETLLPYLDKLNIEKSRLEEMTGKNKGRIIYFMQGR